MTLAPDQVVARRKGVGGSDAAAIVSGSWRSLWEVKTGRKPAADLSRVLPVRLGLATEEFNAHWFERTTGHAVTERGRRVVSAEHPFMRANLDGVVEAVAATWQAKHVNADAEIEEVLARYAPQCTHEMICRGFDKAVLSVLVGTLRYEAPMIEIDPTFAAAYVERCREFWRFVEADEPPTESRGRLPVVFRRGASPPPPAGVEAPIALAPSPPIQIVQPHRKRIGIGVIRHVSRV